MLNGSPKVTSTQSTNCQNKTSLARPRLGFLRMLRTVLYFSVLVEALSPTSGFKDEPSSCKASASCRHTNCCRCPLLASVDHQFSVSASALLACCAVLPKHAKSMPAMRQKRADHIWCDRNQSNEHGQCIGEWHPSIAAPMLHLNSEGRPYCGQHASAGDAQCHLTAHLYRRSQRTVSYSQTRYGPLVGHQRSSW